MKIVLIGGAGTVGSAVRRTLEAEGHQVVVLGRKTSPVALDITDSTSVRNAFAKLGGFDALAVTAGEVAFAPLAQLTREQWQLSLSSKLLGQITLVQEALPFISNGGSFTLVSGILGDEFIAAGAAAATVNGAIQSFARAAACELPNGLRINVVSPTLLKESLGVYGAFFPGFNPVDGATVAQAFKKSILGVESGRIYRVH